MFNTLSGSYGKHRQDANHQLDVDKMNAYFQAYGLDKNTLSFNFIFPPAVDYNYVQ